MTGVNCAVTGNALGDWYLKLARDCDCLILKGKSFHRYGPIIYNDFILMLVRAKEIPNAEWLAVLVLYVWMSDCVSVCAKVIKKFQDNICTTKVCPAMQYCDVITNPRCGRPPFWRSLNHYISMKNHPILIKFGTLQQMLNPMTVTWPKIWIWKSLFWP